MEKMRIFIFISDLYYYIKLYDKNSKDKKMFQHFQ